MDEQRRARFRAWFAVAYGTKDDARTRFIADSGKRGREPLTKGRVTQLFDETEPFGERAARSLADRFGLADDYFLRDSGAGEPEQIIEASETDFAMLEAYKRMPETKRQSMLRQALAEAEDSERVYQAAISRFTSQPSVSDKEVAKHIAPKPSEASSSFRYVKKARVPAKKRRGKKEA